MNLYPGCAVKSKEFKPLSGFSGGTLHKSTSANSFPPNRSQKAQHKPYRRRSDLSYRKESDSDRSSSDSDRSSSDSEENSGDEGYDYVSLFHVCMNYLFPRAFPMQPVHRWIKSAQSVSDMRERRTGKILSPVGRCSLFPEGVFVQSASDKEVTKICFPGVRETFKASSRPSRSSRHIENKQNIVQDSTSY